MDDLEAIRQRRLRELQERQADLAASPQEDAARAEAQAAAQEEAIERVLQQILEPEARERLTRIRMSRPDLADLVTRQLVTAVQRGGIGSRVTDAQLREILARLAPADRDIRITRK